MKKIMFNDRYGLTQAVIEGRKTMTRRLADPKQKYQNLKRWQPCLELDFGLYGLIEDDGWESIEPKYNLGEIVAVAQNYSSFYNILDNTRPIPEGAGWDNKMFVRADLMPHQIRITGIKCERLQDISDKECLREGIRQFTPNFPKNFPIHPTHFVVGDILKDTPREAFASLIDKVSGKGTWASNPWVVAYEFELVK